jgi:type I restriction-modification system DNA methylase subunit
MMNITVHGYSPNLFEAGTRAGVYGVINDRLSELRELFHRQGRLDDSNAKLDEVVKLFAANLAYRLGDIPSFPNPNGHEGEFVEELQNCFRLAAAVPYFQRNDGISIFGTTPALLLTEDDRDFAKELSQLVIDAVSEAFKHLSLGSPYDVLNEAFGHFVRDNFRGNIEDAQYLTPAEVVDFMAEMALTDLEAEGRLAKGREPILLADPCCGVGSFLTTFARKYRDSLGEEAPKLRIYGQDKVERMVRLATVNLALFRLFEHSITIGNSIYAGSPVDRLNGAVDVILTNPPFGARFPHQDVATKCGANLPFFSSLRKLRAPFESELLFIDRNLALLKEGGVLLIVIPDGVVSAAGPASILRNYLRERAEIRAVVDLPAVTFAQAGTRTRTSVLYVKKRSTTALGRNAVFFAIARDLGFQVNSRKGVQIKSASGINELPTLLNDYRTSRDVEFRTPNAIRVGSEDLEEQFTPGHYIAKADRREANSSHDLEVVRLDELAELSGKRKMRRHHAGDAFISVLHVVSEGVLDIRAARAYAPVTPGLPVKPGEVLLSKINPRIPRVIVAPELGQPILCSSEFEVMHPKGEWDAYSIAFLLLSPAVQKQVQALTSGTSSSHNRIKTKDLAGVRIAIPRQGTKSANLLRRQVSEYQSALRKIADGGLQISLLREQEAG